MTHQLDFCPRANTASTSIATTHGTWTSPIVSVLASEVMTLKPGDIILTSAPGIGPLEAGDEMAATIEGIGTLVNPVVATL